jgi:hypothetical protein
VRYVVTEQPDPGRSPLRIPSDLYLPETGPPRRKVERPDDVLPIPLELYLRESDVRPKRRRAKK